MPRSQIISLKLLRSDYILEELNFTRFDTIRDVLYIQRKVLTIIPQEKKILRIRKIFRLLGDYKLDLFFLLFVSELVHCFWQYMKTSSEVFTKAMY